jgi:hypothetical protein
MFRGSVKGTGYPLHSRKGSWDGHLFIGASLLGNLEEGSSAGDFESWTKGALEMVCLSLWGSVKGTWREGSLSGDSEGYLKKALEAGISLHRGSAFGKPGGGLVYQGL